MSGDPRTIKAIPERTADEVSMWQLGWEAVLSAKKAALMALVVGPGIVLAGAAMPVPLAPPHTLAMLAAARTPRPLEPEDFGALLHR